MGFDCYDVLNLSRSASSADVSRAYRRLALKFHPDKGGDVKEFQEFTETFTTSVQLKIPNAQN